MAVCVWKLTCGTLKDEIHILLAQLPFEWVCKISNKPFSGIKSSVAAQLTKQSSTVWTILGFSEMFCCVNIYISCFPVKILGVMINGLVRHVSEKMKKRQVSMGSFCCIFLHTHCHTFLKCIFRCPPSKLQHQHFINECHVLLAHLSTR